jgi:hypothetical protein
MISRVIASDFLTFVDAAGYSFSSRSVDCASGWWRVFKPDLRCNYSVVVAL